MKIHVLIFTVDIPHEYLGNKIYGKEMEKYDIFFISGHDTR